MKTLVKYPDAGNGEVSYAIPETVTALGRLAFSGCDHLTSITIPDSITEISYGAFSQCSGLTSITIPEAVTTIGGLAFQFTGLTSITIPSSVTSIGSGAFNNCDSLKKITFKGSYPLQGAPCLGVDITANVYYPANDTSWTEDVLKDYGGTLTWIPYGDTEDDTHTHSFGDWYETKAPTQEAEGEERRDCSGCDYYETRVKDQLPSNDVISGTCGENLTWTLADGVLIISGTGKMSGCGAYDTPWYANRFAITEVVIETGVTSVDYYAFHGCVNLTSVTIPSTVTSMHYGVFQSCPNLTSAGPIGGGYNIEFGWTDKIPDDAFSACASLISVTIPDSVTSIGDEAFYYCGLTSMTIPDGIVSIGYRAFYGCKSLTSVTIPGSVTSMGGAIFESCNNLTSAGPIGSGYNIEFGWTDKIPSGAFSVCDSLISVTIPDSVTSIGNYAFESCSSLTNIIIPDSVTSIGTHAFKSCSSLTNMSIPNGVTSVGYRAFYGCKSLTSVKIPGSVVTIGEDTFGYCGNLTSAGSVGGGYNIEFGWTDKIPDNAFCGCDSLTSVTIPASITSMGYRVFESCDNLNNAGPIGGGYNIEFGWTDKIPDNAFCGCDSLTSVTIPDGIISIGNEAFMNCSSLTNMLIPDSVTFIGDWVFYGCKSLASVTIPDGVTSIGDLAFYVCESLTSVIIPTNVTSIGDDAFYGCSSLTNMTIPANVTSIGVEAFKGCSRLNSAGPIDSGCNIEYGWVESIPSGAFANCEGLEKVIIPETITSIGATAFQNCENLTEIDFNAVKMADNASHDIFTGAGLKQNGITLTIGSKVTRIPGSLFRNIKVLEFAPNSVCTEIGDWAFSGCVGLTTVTILESIKSIGYGAFSGCSGLTQINYNAIAASCYGEIRSNDPFSNAGASNLALLVGPKVEEIPASLCYGSNVSRVVFSANSVCKSIGGAAFSNCENLTYISIPSSVVEFGYNVFGAAYGVTAGKSGLTSAGPVGGGYSIEFAWIDEIPANVFDECSTLTEISIPESILKIGENAFRDCNQLTSVIIPKNVKTIGHNAFKDCRRLEEILFYPTLMNDLDIDSDVFHCTDGFISESVILTIGSNVTRIPTNLFGTADYDLRPDSSWIHGVEITDIQFEDNSACVSIGTQAFYRCDKLETIEIPASVKIIEKNAFNKCYELADVYYGASEEKWNEIDVARGNTCLENAKIHYTLDSDGGESEPLLNTSVRYFRKWVEDTKTAYWDDAPAVDGLDLGSQVTAETDTSFLPNVDKLVGTYVLVETKPRDDGMIAADILLSIKPVESKTGTVTSADATSIVIGEETYATPADITNPETYVGKRVRYYLFNSILIKIEINTDTSKEYILFLTKYDEPEQIVHFGHTDLSMAKVTDDTDKSFLSNLDNLKNKYVVAEIVENGAVDNLVNIKPIDTLVGTVTAIGTESITVDNTEYPDGTVLHDVKVGDFVLYHIYENKIISIGKLATLTGDLVGWKKETREVSLSVETISGQETIGYYLSDLSTVEDLELLNQLSSGSSTIVTKLLVACDNQGVIYRVKEGKYELVVFSDYSNLSISTGGEITLSVGILDDGKYVEDISGIAFQIEDTSILSVSSTGVEKNRRYVKLKGNKEGTTTVVFSDTTTGTISNLSITVYNNNYHLYTLSNVPMQNIEKYPTNFYNVNGLYIDNYSYEVNEDLSATVKFDVYNTNYTYGAVEVYDENGNITDAALIKKMKSSNTSLKSALWDNLGFLIRDISDGDIMTYRQESGFSKKTSVSVRIPPNGYIKIWTNPQESLVVGLVNAADCLMTMAKLSGDINNYAENSDAFSEAITEKLVTEKVYVELIKEGNKVSKELWDNVGKETFITAEAMGNFTDTIAHNIDKLNLGSLLADTAASFGWSIGENVFTYFAGPAGGALQVMFTIGKAEDVVIQQVDLTQSLDVGCIAIQNQGGGIRHLDQITVRSEVDFSDDIALSVFKVDIDSVASNILQTTNPELYKAISEGTTYTYNISFLRNGKEIQPEGMVTVYIPIPENLKKLAEAGNVRIYRMESDGTMTDMKAKIEGNCFAFTTDHFSIYTIVGFAPKEDAHSHSYNDKVWISDGVYHWRKCTGCNEKLDISSHSGGTATCTQKAICTACRVSYGEMAAHDYETKWNQGNANGHWHECKNCSAHDTQVKHTPGAAATATTAQTCTVCGYVITPALGHTCTAGSKWYSNGTYHWHVCTSCGAWVKTSYHSYSSDTDETCNVCGYTRTVTVTEPTQETEVAMTETTETTDSGEEVIATETAPTIVSTETNENLSDDAVSEDTDTHNVSGVLITVFTIVALGSLTALVILLVYKKRHESE